MAGRTVLLCAGGTGGHLFPAEALAYALTARGWTVHLATDSRALRFTSKFPAKQIHEIQSATFGNRNLIKFAKAGFSILQGIRQSKALLRKIKADAVVGFGGYPTLPPVYAATRLRIPTLLHEQNAVMGRANKALAERVTAIAGGFLAQEGPFVDKIVLTGNPVRPEILEAATKPYTPSLAGDPFQLLVFGGSQGANVFSEMLPQAMALLHPSLRHRIFIVQQARSEDEEELRNAYQRLGVASEVSTFFNNMATRIARAHFVISRSGASTVSEIAVIGRPALLVPYPFALDHDQAANAAALQKAGGAEIVSQDKLTPERLRGMLEAAMNMPEKLSAMAKAAHTVGRPNAAPLLAELVEAISAGESPQLFTRRTAL